VLIPLLPSGRLLLEQVLPHIRLVLPAQALPRAALTHGPNHLAELSLIVLLAEVLVAQPLNLRDVLLDPLAQVVQLLLPLPRGVVHLVARLVRRRGPAAGGAGPLVVLPDLLLEVLDAPPQRLVLALDDGQAGLELHVLRY